MSEESAVAVEQITKEPAASVENKSAKPKDPKKVAAGKRLAEHNKRAKEALKEKMARDAENPEEKESTSTDSQSWIPQQMSFTTVLSVVGLGLTAFDMYMRYKRQQIPERVEEHNKPPANREEESDGQATKQSTMKNPMIGML